MSLTVRIRRGGRERTAAVQQRPARRRLHAVVYARHGRELMGCKSPVREPMLSQVPAQGKGGRATDRLEEA